MAIADRVVNFVVKITGDVKDLTKDLGKVEKDATQASSRISAGMGKVGTFVSQNWQAGLAAAGAAVTAFAAKSVSDFQAAALEARNVAAATGLGVEEASKYLAVLRKMGVEASAGDLADVVLQINQQSKAVEDLGIEASSSGERLTKLIDYIGGITDETERARLASKFFGEEGARQFGVLVDSGGRYKELLNSLSDGEFINAEEARKAAEFDRTLKELQAQVKDLSQALAEDLVDASNDANELGLTGLAKGLFGAGVQFSKVITGVDFAQRTLEYFGVTAENVAEQVGKVADGMPAREVDEFTESMTEQWEAAAAGREQLNRLGRAYQDWQSRMASMQTWIDAHTDRVKKATQAEKDWESAIRDRTDAVLAGIDAEFAASDAQRQLAEATQASWEAYQAWQNAPAVAQRIAEVEAEIAKIQSEDRLSTNDQRRLDELQQELSRLRSTPTGSQAEFDAAFQREQQAILRQAAAAGQLAGFWGADAAGQTRAQIDELGRIRGQVPAQASFIDTVISRLQAGLAAGAGTGGTSRSLDGTGFAQPKQVVQNVTINTGADPQAVMTALQTVAQQGGAYIEWQVR